MLCGGGLEAFAASAVLADYHPSSVIEKTGFLFIAKRNILVAVGKNAVFQLFNICSNTLFHAVSVLSPDF